VPDHPDSEQLAAFQAGDGDRRHRADVQTHLDGCPSCAEVVASVEQARRRLALLEEPDLPAGLHDRLAAALEVEAARLPAEDRPLLRFGRPGPRSATGRADAGPDGAAAEMDPGHAAAGQHRARSEAGAGGPAGGPRTGGAERPHPRPVPWYRRRAAAWGVAAALVLAALVTVPLLERSSNLSTAGGGGGSNAAQSGASPEAATGQVPMIRVPGEVSAATVRSELATDARARAALDAASGRAAGGPSAAPNPSHGAADAPRSSQQPGGASRSAPDLQAAPPNLQACLPAATAAADLATRPLVPAFYVQGTYQGREATILVTTSTSQPGRVDLWVFPRNRCSSPPLTTERVR
jgi:hypothetical protein